MHIVKLDAKNGSVSIDSLPIQVDENGILASSIIKLCSLPLKPSKEQLQYRLLRKTSVCGQSADCVIEVGHGGIYSVTFLFDLIEFFESNILESKILKTCERYLKSKFISNHSSSAILNFCEAGNAIALYDAKQGDLSLEIRFERKSDSLD